MRPKFKLPLISLLAVAMTAQADISGRVFRDVNQNGTQDSLEAGEAGVHVRAYLAANVLTAETTSGSNGDYTLTLGAGDYRIEFGGLEFLEPAGGTVSSSVKFASNGATGLNYALNNPNQYCEAGTFQGLSLPRVQAVQFTNGQRGLNSTLRALGSYPYNITPINPAAAESSDLDAIVGDVGAIFALAHHRRSNYLMVGSFVRRHAELGPGRGPGTNNTGVVYVVDPGTNGALANTAKVFADINQIAGSNVTGSNPRPNPIPGVPDYDFFHDTGNSNTTSSAVDLFRSIGRTGLGGIDLSEDGNTLYVVSLGDRRLYQLDSSSLNSRPSLAVPTTPVETTFSNPSVAIPTGICANPADAQPFAAKFVDGFLYVGVTCTGESTIPLVPPTELNGATPTSRGDLTQLRAVIWRFNPATQMFDDAPGMPTNPVLNFSLNYPRGCIQPVANGNGLPGQTTANGGGNCALPANAADSRGLWQPWQPNWQVIFSDVAPGNIQDSDFFIEYPQPMLSDLEFDATGAMILGIRDLNGDKVGYCAGSPNVNEGAQPGTDGGIAGCTSAQHAANGAHRGNGEGDILRACGSTTGGWTLESGGTCGGVSANNPLPSGTAPANGQGPGNGEFYWADSGPGGLDNSDPTPGVGLGYFGGNGHGETGMGALALVVNPNFDLIASGTPGSYVISNMIDTRAFYDGGLIWFNNRNGSSAKRIRVYDENILTGGKSGGLGDLELMCAPPPTEVGNRVWNDANGNGIQDAGEVGIAGLRVEIWSAGGSRLSRVFTDANGEWYTTFSVGTADPSDTDAAIILPDPYDTQYTVHIRNSQTGGPGTFGSGVLAGFTATVPNSDATSNGFLRDSNGLLQIDPNGGGFNPPARVGAVFTLNGMGETDHSLDFGFFDPAGTSVNPGITIDDFQTQCGNTPRTYDVVVTNPSTGSADFTNMPFGLAHPANIAPSSWTCTTTSGTASCSAANGSGNPAASLTLDMNTNSVVTIQVTVAESPACTNDSGNVVLQATIPQLWTGFQDTDISDNFDDDIDVPTGDLSILLSEPTGQYCPGQTSVFTLTVSNAGPATAVNVPVNMPLTDPPYNPGLTNWSRTGGTGTVVSGASGITPALNSVITLEAGQSVIYTIQAYVRSNFGAPTLDQTATLTVPPGFIDSSAANNSAAESSVSCAGPPVSTSFCATPGVEGVPANPISGVVNTYRQGNVTTAAAGTANGGGSCAIGTVPLVVGGRLGAAVNVAVGDLLMIVQMQDATIDSADSANYGDGTAADSNNAGGVTDFQTVGRYEYVRAATANATLGATTLCVSGAGVNSGLLHQYFHDIGGGSVRKQTFQVVRIPQYSNVTLSDTTALTALPWNGRIGGIVALDVEDQLSFNNTGSINVSGQGFRGALGVNRFGDAGTANDSFRNLASIACHGSKGEGLAGTPSTLSVGSPDYPFGSLGRGAPGNAGGGGNDGVCSGGANQDGGGGGGAGCGDGGFGGESQSGVVFSPGRGGGDFDDGLTDAQLMRGRLILGGGGGAGSSNSSTRSSGGNGGGVVILRAGSIVGGGTVNASGANGQTGGNDQDGGGGAGGGGSVLIYTNPAGPADMSGITVTTAGGIGGEGISGGGARGNGGGGGGGCFASSAISGQLPGGILVGGGAAGNYTGDDTPGIAGEAGRSAFSLPAVDNTPGAQPGYICGDSLVPVTLGHVQFAQMGAGRVRANFTTTSQAGTLGFNIYGVGFEGRRLQLTQQPTMANESATLSLADYQIDFDSLGLVEFMIEEITTKGTGTFYGPYQLAEEYGVRPQMQQIGWAQIRSDVTAAANARQARLRALEGGVDELEVRVDTDGIYRITYEQLAAAGAVWNGTPAAALGLALDGTAQSLRRFGGASFGPGSAIEFYGQSVKDSLYTTAQVYRLRRDLSSPDVASLAAEPGDLARKDRADHWVTLDSNRYYGLDSPLSDPWYHDRLTRAGVSAVHKDYTLTLSNYAGGSVEAVRVNLWGGLDYPGGVPDHSVSVLVNGTLVGGEVFDGIVERELSFDLPAGLLTAGDNTVTVRLNPDTAFQTDRINIESIALRYARQLVASDQRLDFYAAADAPLLAPIKSGADLVFDNGFEAGAQGACGVGERGCAAYAVAGFSESARVYRSRAGQLSRLQVVYQGGELRFAVRESGNDRYWIVESAAATQAELQVAPPADPNLLQGVADYLAIAHPMFVEGEGRVALDRLLTRRSSEGLQTKVVDVTQLYQRYTGSRVDPQAIRQYVADAAARLGVRYVLLVGGDSYDYADNLGLGAYSFVPTIYRRTHDYVSYAPVDSVFVDLDANGLPDLPIGRMPVRSAAELNAMITKIEQQEQSTYLRTSVHLADRLASTDAMSFKNISLNFLNALDASWRDELPVQIYLDDYAHSSAGVNSARQALVQALGSGQMLTTYIGHSSPSIWSRERLLDSNMVQNGVLQNGLSPTTVVQFGCWGAYYAVPQYNSISHAWLLGSTGAAALVGASGLTATQSDELMALALLPRLSSSDARLGDVITDAKAEVQLRNPAAIDVILGTQLLGDPAMRINPTR